MIEKREHTDDYQDRTLYIPGPTKMREDIIAEIYQPMFGYRMDRMTDLYTTIVEDTKEFLGTDNDVMAPAGLGTEIWKSSVFNLVGENILMSTCGSFSERYANVMERLSKNVDRVEYEWGQAIKLEDIREALEPSGKQYDMVATVMNRGSIDVRNPIEEISDVVAEYLDIYLVVDAMSTSGGDYVDINEYNIDVVFVPSQKALTIPLGLAVCTVNDEAYEHEPSKDSMPWCSDFQRAFDYYDRKDQTHSTLAIFIVLAYRKQMKRMFEEGHGGRGRCHCETAEYTRKRAYEHFDIFPEEDYGPQTIACIESMQGIDIATTIEEVNEEYNMVLSNGHSSAPGERTFCTGRTGEYDVKSIKVLTDVIEDVAGL